MEIKGKYYQMDAEEAALFESFLAQVKSILSAKRYDIFQRYLIHLAEIQDPYNKKYPFIDSLYHGITVAKFCIMFKSDESETLLIAAVGHDWDRACGEKRIKSTDFPNTKEGNEEYKRQHAQNSASLFDQVMQKFYEPELAAEVYEMIVLHEVGGEGELGILDKADGITLIFPKMSNYYRLGRNYKGPNGEALNDDELEAARKKGYQIKVIFMTETMQAQDLSQIKKLAKANKDQYDPKVAKELFEILGI